MRNAIAGLAAVLAVLATAGCGAGEDIQGGGTIPGGSMTVAALLPLQGPDADAVRDMIAGAKLALNEAGGEVGRLRVGLAVYDEGARRPDAVARRSIEDIQIAAVIGGLRSGDAAREIPILNAAGILHVAPGAADPALVTTPELHPSGKRTFFGLAPDARAQAETMLEAAGPGPVAVERDAGREGKALGDALTKAAGERLDPEATTILYAGTDPESAAAVARSLPRDGRVVFGDAIARTGLADRLRGATARRARFVSAVPRTPPPAFASAFEDVFDREPGPYALLGHEAMSRVLDAMREAAPRTTYRQRIIDAYAGAAAPLEPQIWPASGRE
jgi:hypothetical protein